jgi:tripartite-type tricarboxylate transporter receptor subunit TctC
MNLKNFKLITRPTLYAQVLIAGLIATALLPSRAQTSSYPIKPITLIVPFVPGGTTDIVGRIVAEGLGKKLGQPVIIDNKGGAGGNIGAAAAAQAKPDGYTLLMGYNGTNAINPSLYGSLTWHPQKSFEPISLVARVNNVVIVNPTVKAKTLPELVSYAKLHPGEVNYGSAGPGSIFHLAGEILEQQTGIQITHVPYKGAAPALTDLMGGQVQVMFSTIPAALAFIKSEKVRAIAVTGAQRSPLFPNLPTAREAGYPGMVVDSWFAVFGPKGLPVELQTRLNTAIREVLSDPVTIRKMEEQGAQPKGSSVAELAELLASDLKSWKAVIQSAKVSLD